MVQTKHPFCWILLIISMQAAAQIPRNAAGHFEYRQTIPADKAISGSLPERVRNFYRQPFLVHWDTVYSSQQPAGTLTTGIGYIQIRLKRGLLYQNIPINLQYDILTTDNGYEYLIHEFQGRPTERTGMYSLEEKPAHLSNAEYERLLGGIHSYTMKMIGWMKRELAEAKD